MCPPMPSSRRFARTTIAIAFHRMRLLIRRSIFAAAGIGHLLGRVDRVHIRCIGRERQLDAVLRCANLEVTQQTTDARRAAVLQNVVERLEPLARLECFELTGVGGS